MFTNNIFCLGLILITNTVLPAVTNFFSLVANNFGGGKFFSKFGRNIFYICLELSTLSVTALAAYETSKRKSNEAGIKLIFSAVLSSGISLFGISLLYATSGSIFFHDIIGAIVSNNLTVLGFILFFGGLSFKISLVTFHFWISGIL